MTTLEPLDDGTLSDLIFIVAQTATPDDGCLEWPGYRMPGGYGQVRIAGTLYLATHVVLEAAGSPRPPAPGDQALHACDNPPCVNPHHLRWGTQSENVADALDRDRHVAPNGADNGRAKITEDDVREIRTDPRSAAVTARDYGLSKSAVVHIRARRSWAHVPDTPEDAPSDALSPEEDEQDPHTLFAPPAPVPQCGVAYCRRPSSLDPTSDADPICAMHVR